MSDDSLVKFFSIIKSQENDIASVTKIIIETHVEENAIRIITTR